jgi:hypothetical protein
MSGYNILLGYGGGVNTSAGQVGFNDDTPGTNKTFTLPPFNTIKFEMWGGGGAGGGGDHNVAVNGGVGTQSDVLFPTLTGTTTINNPWDPTTFSIGSVGGFDGTDRSDKDRYGYAGYLNGRVTLSLAEGLKVTVDRWLADSHEAPGGTYTLMRPEWFFNNGVPFISNSDGLFVYSEPRYSYGRDTSCFGTSLILTQNTFIVRIYWAKKGYPFTSDPNEGGFPVGVLASPITLTTTTYYNNISVVAGGGGGGTGGNNNGTKTGTGGGGGTSSGSLPVGTLIKVNGSSGTNAVDGSPGYGGEAGNAPGTAGNPGSTGGAGGAPGGGGGGGGYDNGAAPGGGKKSGGGSVKDSAGGGGGGGGGYASVSFVKGQIPQRSTITYSVGDRGIAGPAEYPGGSGARGKFKITWT